MSQGENHVLKRVAAGGDQDRVAEKLGEITRFLQGLMSEDVVVR